MPGKHKEPTISFRVSKWQKALIEERAGMSGHSKKDFIARSCIYSNIVVVGNQTNIRCIMDKLQEMQYTMKEIARQIQTGSFSLNEDTYKSMEQNYLALVVTVVDIINGASYLFGKEPYNDNQHWKKELELEQLRDVLGLDAACNSLKI